MKKYFGTDGIRGIANVELTPELAYKVAKALSIVIKEKNEKPTVIIGKDTRVSCDLLESALIAGFLSSGVDVKLLGIIPTPGVAYLTRILKFDAGIVISASHNSYEYNGIKVFCNKGMKISDDEEQKIEKIINDNIEFEKNENIGRLEYSFNLVEQYENMIIEEFRDLTCDFKIAIDVANGATYNSAKNIFEKIGLKFQLINNIPDGENINKQCGSTHMDELKKYVITNKMDIGIAYDGDGDRCLAIDENGTELDGDAFLALMGNYLNKKGKLKNNTIVATVMSNMGLNIFAEHNKLKMVQTKVGDKYVLEEIINGDYNFGGEQSGHMIFFNYNPTGDGILTSLMLLKVLAEENKKASNIWDDFRKYPQVLINVTVDSKKKYDYNKNEKIMAEIHKLENEFMGKGRVLIRASGTEPIVRVMIEGSDENYITLKAKYIAKVIQENLK